MGFYSRGGKCLQRGTDWFLISSRLRLVFRKVKKHIVDYRITIQLVALLVSICLIFRLLSNRYNLPKPLQVKEDPRHLLPKRGRWTQSRQIIRHSRQTTLFWWLSGIPRMLCVCRSSSKAFLNIWEFITFTKLLRNCFAFPCDITFPLYGLSRTEGCFCILEGSFLCS